MFPAFYSRTQQRPFEFRNNAYHSGDLHVDIIDGIPRFTGSGSYASLFGDQWKEYRKTQLDSYTGLPITESRLLRCLGPLKDKLKGKVVLEAGCGAGRFTEVLLKLGAQLVSADMSSAVEVNKENFPINENHQVIQADINNMPYDDGTFDVVLCLGVIQHTPGPDQTIGNLYKLVKPGGWLVIDHYTYTRSNVLRLAPLYRRSLRKKKASETIPIVNKLIRRYLPLHKKYANNKLVSMMLNRISPVISYYKAFPGLTDDLQKEWALLDTHDSLTDWFKHFRNKKQIIAILTKLGGVDIWCEYGGNGVEARCKKL